jgi:hypothetical protein
MHITNFLMAKPFFRLELRIVSNAVTVVPPLEVVHSAVKVCVVGSSWQLLVETLSLSPSIFLSLLGSRSSFSALCLFLIFRSPLLAPLSTPRLSIAYAHVQRRHAWNGRVCAQDLCNVALGVTKGVHDWGQSTVAVHNRRSFFPAVGCEIDIVRHLLLLSGSVPGLENAINDFVVTVMSFGWLWLTDPSTKFEVCRRCCPLLATAIAL